MQTPIPVLQTLFSYVIFFLVWPSKFNLSIFVILFLCILNLTNRKIFTRNNRKLSWISNKLIIIYNELIYSDYRERSVFVDCWWPLLTKAVQNQHLPLERSLLERAVMYLYCILFFILFYLWSDPAQELKLTIKNKQSFHWWSCLLLPVIYNHQRNLMCFINT